MNIQELFSGLADASVEGRRPKYELNGNYVSEVCALKLVEGFKTKGISYVIETVCLESDNPEIKVGQPRSYTINRLDSRVDYEKASALGNVKGFLIAIVHAKFGDKAEGLIADMNTDGPQKNPDGTVKTSEQKWTELGILSVEDDGSIFVGCKFRANVTRIHTKRSNPKDGGTGREEDKFALPTFKPYAIAS